jgi:hypothetical protein
MPMTEAASVYDNSIQVPETPRDVEEGVAQLELMIKWGGPCNS